MTAPLAAIGRSATGRRHRHIRRIALGTGVALIAGTGMFVGTSVAAAAVPTFPDNIAVFPDRDFVSVEGYAEHAGDTALLEVTRPGVGVVGSARAKVSGTDVAFEVNHPGGVCWGAGATGLNVTPDIVPGDVVSISFNGQRAGETTVGDGYVTAPPTVDGNVLTVRGHVGASVKPANTEQRIIQPEFKDTPINRRDIRAVEGPLTPAAKGGYSSSLEFSGENFLATYVFDDPAMARLAAESSLGARLMSWQVVDLAGNRQGLTIAEFGESGGPGMGGCPNGPLLSGPAGPTNVRAIAVANGVRLTWTPAVAVAGTPAILGYRVTAVAATANAQGEQTALQVRVPSPTATGTTVTGFTAGEDYRIEVESVSRVGLTMPALIPDIETDRTPPILKATPNGGSFVTPPTVTLVSDEAGTDIYYTLDGSNPIEADVLSPRAIPYDRPFVVESTSDLNFAGYDISGNVSLIGTAHFEITNKPVPAAPTITSVEAGLKNATVAWSAGDASITGYTVRAYTGGQPVGEPVVPNPATATSVQIGGLTVGTAYTFTVTATNANGTSSESVKSAPVTPFGAVIAFAGPDQTVTRAATPTTVRLSGNGSSTTAGVSYLWKQTGGDPVTLNGAATLSPSFVLPVYRFPMTNNPLTFGLTVTTTDGTTTDEVLVTPKPDQVQLATARWKLGDFRVTGGGSTVGGTVTIHKGSLAGPVMGSGPLVAAAAPATGSTFDIRVRTTGGDFSTNPGTIWIESTLGGTAGPFTVSN